MAFGGAMPVSRFFIIPIPLFIVDFRRRRTDRIAGHRLPVPWVDDGRVESRTDQKWISATNIGTEVCVVPGCSEERVPYMLCQYS